MTRLLTASCLTYTPACSTATPSQSSTSSTSGVYHVHSTSSVSSSVSANPSTPVSSRDLAFVETPLTKTSQSSQDASVSLVTRLTSTAIDMTDVTSSTDVAEETLLNQSQISRLESACQEVTLAITMFAEFVRKSCSSLPEKSKGSNSTPRGKRMLPMSPEKTVGTPALNTAHLRKINMLRTISLASQESKES